MEKIGTENTYAMIVIISVNFGREYDNMRLVVRLGDGAIENISFVLKVLVLL